MGSGGEITPPPPTPPPVSVMMHATGSLQKNYIKQNNFEECFVRDFYESTYYYLYGRQCQYDITIKLSRGVPLRMRSTVNQRTLILCVLLYLCSLTPQINLKKNRQKGEYDTQMHLLKKLVASFPKKKKSYCHKIACRAPHDNITIAT